MKFYIALVLFISSTIINSQNPTKLYEYSGTNSAHTFETLDSSWHITMGKSVMYNGNGLGVDTNACNNLIDMVQNFNSPGDVIFTKFNFNSNKAELWTTNVNSNTCSYLDEISYPTMYHQHTDDSLHFYFEIHGNYDSVTLFSTNGTSNSIINLGVFDSVFNFTENRQLNINYFFSKQKGSGNIQLWRTDGSKSGTILLRQHGPIEFIDIEQNSNGNFLYLVDSSNKSYIISSNGSKNGTIKLMDINLIHPNAFYSLFISSNSSTFFAQIHSDSLNRFKTNFWITDGTPSGTNLIHSFYQSNTPQFIHNQNDNFLTYLYRDTLNFKLQVWHLNLTSNHTYLSDSFDYIGGIRTVDDGKRAYVLGDVNGFSGIYHVDLLNQSKLLLANSQGNNRIVNILPIKDKVYLETKQTVNDQESDLWVINESTNIISKLGRYDRLSGIRPNHDSTILFMQALFRFGNDIHILTADVNTMNPPRLAHDFVGSVGSSIYYLGDVNNEAYYLAPAGLNSAFWKVTPDTAIRIFRASFIQFLFNKKNGDMYWFSTSIGSGPIEFWKLNGWTTTYTNIVTACNEYISPTGKIYDSTGIYNDTLVNHINHDSIIFTYLNINNAVSRINRINNSTRLYNIEQGDRYQWINCINNDPIAGETQRNFTPLYPGSFACIIEQNNCTDTSLCISVNDVGINEYYHSKINIYPNPFSDRLVIDGITDLKNTQISVYDISGRVIAVDHVNTSRYVLNLWSKPSGVYFVRLVGNDLNEGFKVVKE